MRGNLRSGEQRVSAAEMWRYGSTQPHNFENRVYCTVTPTQHKYRKVSIKHGGASRCTTIRYRRTPIIITDQHTRHSTQSTQTLIIDRHVRHNTPKHELRSPIDTPDTAHSTHELRTQTYTPDTAHSTHQPLPQMDTPDTAHTKHELRAQTDTFDTTHRAYQTSSHTDTPDTAHTNPYHRRRKHPKQHTQHTNSDSRRRTRQTRHTPHTNSYHRRWTHQTQYTPYKNSDRSFFLLLSKVCSKNGGGCACPRGVSASPG
jgi:hypothetical protein